MKKANRILHVKQRAYERYGLVITKDDIQDMEKQIRTERSVPVADMHKSRRYRTHIVSVKDTQVCVWYDKEKKQIATCLPHNGVEMRKFYGEV